jgi:hydroxymethylbilane synthase
MTARTIRIGTRRSALAQWQAEWVASRLTGVEVELVYITTHGDSLSAPLGQIGGTGVFTKEIQRALLENRIDLAVHSLKDLPTQSVAGLSIAAVPERHSVRDVLLCREARTLETLAPASAIGTGSIRRRAQLLALRPDLQLIDIRGNIDTRLQKLDAGMYDAIVLAEAGVQRLRLEHRISEVLTTRQMLPAVGQGALAVEARAGDSFSMQVAAQLNDTETHAAVRAERTFLSELRAGCLAPVAAWARTVAGTLLIEAAVFEICGKHHLAVCREGDLEKPDELGKQAAADLLARGAERLIQAARTV